MEKWGRGKGEQINEKTVDESSTTGASKKIKKKKTGITEAGPETVRL